MQENDKHKDQLDRNSRKEKRFKNFGFKPKQPIGTADEIIAESGQFMLSGESVKVLTDRIEYGLLTKDPELMTLNLDRLAHLLKLKLQNIEFQQENLKSLSWQSGVVRLAISRAHHGSLRIPDFKNRIHSDTYENDSIVERLFNILNAYVNLSTVEIKGTSKQFTPYHWLRIPRDMAAIRNNLGVAAYHLSQLLEHRSNSDRSVRQTFDQMLSANLDIMLYSAVYGPMLTDQSPQNRMDILKSHIQSVDNFLDSPQPSLRNDPELLSVSSAHLQHIMSITDQAKAVLNSQTN